MAKAVIINKTRIKVKSKRLDNYGNLWLTPDPTGAEIKIGEKRSQYFGVCQVGAELELGWAEFDGKKYVAEIISVEGNAPATTSTPIKSMPEASKSETSPTGRDQSIERLAWYKSAVKIITCPHASEILAPIELDAVRLSVKIELFRVLGIKIE